MKKKIPGNKSHTEDVGMAPEKHNFIMRKKSGATVNFVEEKFACGYRRKNRGEE